MSNKTNTQQLIQRSLKYCESRQFSDAIKTLKIVIKKYPNQLEALTLLGTVHLHQANFELGIEFLKKALLISPNQSFALNNIGNGYYELKDYQSAIISFDKAISLNPNDFRAYYDRGRSYDAINEYSKAIYSYEKALKINRNFIEAYKSISAALKKKLEYEKAILYLNEALKLNNQDIDLFLLLGGLLDNVCEYHKAISKYKEALRIEPNSIRIHEQIVSSALNNPTTNFEIDVLNKLLQIDPKNLIGNRAKAKIENHSGNFEKSIQFYRKLLLIDPLNTPDYLMGISITQNLMGSNAFKNEILNVINNTANKKFNRIYNLYFALGKFYKDQKKYKESFINYLHGRSLKKKSSKYNISKGISELSNMRIKFDQKYVDKLSEYKSESVLPVFIVGMPRSGTTLIETILSSKHQNVTGIGESPFWEPTSDLSMFKNKDYKIKYLGIADRYLKFINDIAGNDKNVVRIIDKLPHNFIRLGIILSIFPNAKIIHCNRNAIDTCFSIFTTPFESNYHDYANDLEGLANYYIEYRKLMNHWEALFPNRIFTVNYEDLVSSNDLWTKKIFDFLGLSNKNFMKKNPSSKNLILTASSWQVRQPIYKSSLNRINNYREELEPLINIFRMYPKLINLS